jgi:hypothetical protein
MDDPETRRARLYTAARRIKNDQEPRGARQGLQRPGPGASQDDWDHYLCAKGEAAMDAGDFSIWFDA